jgi:hypothetical protein
MDEFHISVQEFSAPEARKTSHIKLVGKFMVLICPSPFSLLSIAYRENIPAPSFDLRRERED